MKKIILPILILALGMGAMMGLIQSGTSEQRVDVSSAPLQVNTIDVEQQDEQIRIYASGVVQSSNMVNLVPQVQERIVYTAPDLRAGRRFSKGEIIAKIEASDYELAVAQEHNRVEQAKLNLTIETERQADAQREWELLGNTDSAPELASRRPQLRLAEIAVEAAEAGLKRADLALTRTVIVAPFDSLVQQEQLEIGQVVGASPVASLQGTKQFQVKVSIPTSQLFHILIPDVNSKTGSEVKVVLNISNVVRVEKKGVVLGVESELDPRARTAQLLIGIDNPLDGSETPLLIGSYVDVEIQGKSIQQTVRLPAAALREGSYVLLADSDLKLAKRDVEVGWFDNEDVVLTNGLDVGERVVTTPISFPIYGNPLTILNE